MAANVQTMAYARAGGVPWHGLGRPVGDATTSLEMIAAAGLDWRVGKRRMLVEYADGQYAPIPDAFALVREDSGRILGHGVTDGYEILQNADAFAFLDGLLADGVITYETAGALGGGETVWALARIPDGVTSIAGDAFEAYMLISTGHDGASAVHIRSTSVRVVCQNTLNAALASKGAQHAYRLRHTRSLPDRMAEAAAALQMVTEAQRKLAAFLDQAAHTNAAQPDFVAVEAALFGPADDRGPRVKANVQRFRRVVAVEAATYGPTFYSLTNGITGFADHVKAGGVAFLNGDRTETLRERRMDSALFGSADAFKADGIEAVRERMALASV